MKKENARVPGLGARASHCAIDEAGEPTQFTATVGQG